MNEQKKPLDNGSAQQLKKSLSGKLDKSIAHPKQKINTLRDLRIRNNLTADEIVGKVREQYPKYDKTLQSKCEQTDKYGVTLCPDAMRALLSSYGGLMKSVTKVENRTLKNRIYCRLSDETFIKFRECMKTDGFTTMQGCITFLVDQYIYSKKGVMEK